LTKVTRLHRLRLFWPFFFFLFSGSI